MDFDTPMDGVDMDLERNVPDDDELEEMDDGQWFSMGMTKEEKIEARKPWRLNLIIKMVGRSIGYQLLLRRLQAMWRPQQPFTLIDLSNNYFIARFTNKQDYEVALLNGPWFISIHYLHIQQWVPNFMPKSTIIVWLHVLVRFPVLPVKYYTTIKWLERARNKIGSTIKVDRTPLLASRGKFARVCVEVDLIKPLKKGY